MRGLLYDILISVGKKSGIPGFKSGFWFLPTMLFWDSCFNTLSLIFYPLCKMAQSASQAVMRIKWGNVCANHLTLVSVQNLLVSKPNQLCHVSLKKWNTNTLNSFHVIVLSAYPCIQYFSQMFTIYLSLQDLEYDFVPRRNLISTS
jgi:hypothetical protein